MATEMYWTDYAIESYGLGDVPADMPQSLEEFRTYLAACGMDEPDGLTEHGGNIVADMPYGVLGTAPREYGDGRCVLAYCYDPED
jgi:hypothetical protein